MFNILSVDCETLGLDLYHGARPFITTTCTGEGKQRTWEWNVNPLTREPIIPLAEKRECQKLIDSADVIVAQHSKFDYAALRTIGITWDYSKVFDTLIAAHLLASNHRHDLTTLAMTYLSTNIEPLETRMKRAVNDARRLAKKQFPEWRLAKEGLPDMPSAKAETEEKKGQGVQGSSPWKFDCWLPKAIVKHAITNLRFDLLPKDLQQPTVVNLKKSEYTVRIDRGTKWGNPFVIGKDGTRGDVIRKYVDYILKSDLLSDIPELWGKVLGCHCSPEQCHGDVLKALCHPWWTVTLDYANGDSEVTAALYHVMLAEIKERGLLEIFNERMKVIPVAAKIEHRGVTINAQRLHELEAEYRQEAEEAEAICLDVAKGYNYDLELPKGSRNKSLEKFFWEVLELPKIINPKSKNKSATINKDAMAEYIRILPPRSPALTFVKKLTKRRKVGTNLQFMEGYRSFWIPLGIKNDKGQELWCLLHPNLNPTATSTLRWSSSNPNSQNVAKEDSQCERCEGEGEDQHGSICSDCNGTGIAYHSLRYLFGPKPGREWWSMDYENIELRIPAYESGEQVMIDLFEKPDEGPYYGSYHLLNAGIVYPDLFWPLAEKKGAFKDKYKATNYQWIKNFGFADQYGAVLGSGTADRAAHKPGAQAMIASKLLKKAELNQRMMDMANRLGYVETIPDKTVNPNRGYPILCTRSARGNILSTVPLSYHVQSTAMQCTTKAMVRCDAYLEQDTSDDAAFITLQVHDELVFDFPKGGAANLPKVKELQRLMEMSGDDIGVPLKVSTSYHPDNWSETAQPL